jgi:hypothetical protein
MDIELSLNFSPIGNKETTAHLVVSMEARLYNTSINSW